MNNYIFFRTDRIGDFLVSAILLKSIKRNNKNSLITVISSEKNFYYIKSFDFIDEVILYPKTFIKKITLFFYLFKRKYNLVGVLDGKKRSIYFTLFLKSNHKILITGKKIYKKIFKNVYKRIFFFEESLSRIDEIKQILEIISFKLDVSDQNLFEKRNFNFNEYIKIKKKYLLFHFDEKWIYKNYIKEYTSIEPTFDEFITFVNNLAIKTLGSVVISTGNISNPIIDKFNSNFKKYNNKLYLKEYNGQCIFLTNDLNFFELEFLVKNSSVVIACHGAITHLASAFNKKIIDIFEEKKRIFILNGINI